MMYLLVKLFIGIKNISGTCSSLQLLHCAFCSRSAMGGDERLSRPLGAHAPWLGSVNTRSPIHGKRSTVYGLSGCGQIS